MGVVTLLLLLTTYALAFVPTAPEVLQRPVDVAVDARGRVFIADQDASPVFVLAPGGRLTLLARAPAGSRESLYRVRALTVAKDQGVVAAAPGSYGVYRIAADGGLTALAPGQFSHPIDVVVDEAGDIVVADLQLAAVIHLSPGGAPGRQTRVLTPRALAIDGDGIVVVADRGLVRVSAAGQVEPVTSAAAFGFPNGVAVLASGEYLVSDGYARTLWRVSRDGKLTPFSKGDPLRSPQGVCVTPGGDVLVADADARAVFRIGTNGVASVLIKSE